MRSTSTEFRCKQCQALLAKQDRDGLSIRRGDMQTTVTGTDFTVAVTCYRCKTPNVATSPHAHADARASRRERERRVARRRSSTSSPPSA
jgi:phage FluMu protein Com